MARITTEDCERIVSNRFEFVLLAAERACELARTAMPSEETVDTKLGPDYRTLNQPWEADEDSIAQAEAQAAAALRSDEFLSRPGCDTDEGRGLTGELYPAALISKGLLRESQ